MKTQKVTHTLGATLLLLLLSLGSLAEDSHYTQAELNQLLAPVALYPDTVLSHVLIASTYPLEVVQAHRWTQRHPGQDGGAAVSAVEHEPWDPSVKALVAFPHLLERMSDDLDWTQRLGDAFLHNEEAVLAGIQDLRQRAYDSGHLETTEHQTVVVERKTIIVEPRVSEVIYLPYYDTRVVYGPWRWHHHPPSVWHRPSRGYWHSGIFWSFGARIDHHDFYFSGFHWSNHHTVVIDTHHSHKRPRLHSSRSVVRYKKAKRWRHDPAHRHGVEYRHTNVRHKYTTPGRAQRAQPASTERRHRTDSLQRRLQSQPEHRANQRKPPRLERHENRKKPLNARRDEQNRAERQREQRREPNQVNERRHSTRTDRHPRNERQERRNNARERQHRQPERSQQNFQRSTRERVDAARNSRTITDRARERRER
ncbi:DUF3300 domain-containing protein [Marinimicrobium locisalis]|uniref:DUF3300 domain-containing protein n=1 Tax=Marinimicrobium locisalis TaxID=546022 RepID=UPI00322157A5